MYCFTVLFGVVHSTVHVLYSQYIHRHAIARVCTLCTFLQPSLTRWQPVHVWQDAVSNSGVRDHGIACTIGIYTCSCPLPAETHVHDNRYYNIVLINTTVTVAVTEHAA